MSLSPRRSLNSDTVRPLREALRIRLEIASLDHERSFLAAVRASRKIHHPWVTPPATSISFRKYIEAKSGERNISYFAFSDADELLGVVNISEIVRGGFCSAYLGYYVFSPHEKRGVMTAVLRKVVTRAFRVHGLHRVEANIQPLNVASIRLVRRLGFRKEGLSHKYLKVNGKWCDHERWAMTKEDWPAPRGQVG
jgi:[ribosomal protein S5]-alanine N-acetyltransferase